MAERNKIVSYLNELLGISDFDDYCVNGLQVEGKKNVRKIIFGVSVSKRLFQQAIERNADMIIVHHGIFWKSNPFPFFLVGIFRERLALLIKNDINLLGYHLPLDAHPEFGNNAQLMSLLNIEPVKSVEIGLLGKLKEKMPRQAFIELVNEKVGTQAQIFPFGSNYVKRIYISSGGSSHHYKLAKENDADTFIGGDIKENIVRELEETAINYINAGHYNTETLGVKALTNIIAKKFDVDCEFVDVPNSV